MYKIPGKTVFLGKKIISLPSCESTNTLMVSMSQSGFVDEGTIIITDNQTAGRGQAGNRWVSEPGSNLTFSLLLKPTFLEPAQQFYLNMAVGLGICDALSSLLKEKKPALSEIKLKWPNDVMMHAQKTCGILIENQVQGQSFSQAVVGIGLNVNQKKFEWPGVTSLRTMAEQEFDRSQVLEILLEKLEARYLQLKRRELEQLKSDYYSVLFWRDEPHDFSADGRMLSGILQGIDDVGRLLVLVDGDIMSFNFKEIRFIQ